MEGKDTVLPVNEDRLKTYMAETYDLSDIQFQSYLKISNDFDTEDALLKTRRMSASELKKQKKALYGKYYDAVKDIFNNEQFFNWSTCIERLDRYRTLSERLFVPRNKLRALYNAEKKWKQERKTMWNSSIEESLKHKKNAELLDDLQNRTYQILGQKDAEWYWQQKFLTDMAFRNMDKYSVSYNEGMAIAEIESEYKTKRFILNSDKSRRRTDIDADIVKSETNKIEAIRKAIPEDAAERWQTINNHTLDYTLRKVYGMNKEQIVKYKNAYNAYVIEEYGILDSKTLSVSEKEKKLEEANDEFCEKVRSFAPAETFKKWLGRRQYVFNRRMVQKEIRPEIF